MRSSIRQTITATLLLLCCASARAEVISSYVFSGVIKSSGRGDIDLFSPKTSGRVITGPVLEAFRQDNNGELVFAVDVNEAASGSEFADCQGIAVKSALLTVTFANGEEVQYSQYRTPTRSLLAEDGSTARTEYYTLIGNAGTNRISPNSDSELTNSSIDETLYMAIDRDLSDAVAAELSIVLLTTNLSLGDPEAFYDYSNGFEEVAMLTREDVLYLEQLAPGRELAPLVLTDEPVYDWVYYPSSQTYYVVAYEDLFPARGDYDFNDLVVAYQVGLGMDAQNDIAVVRGNGYLLARGAAYNHDWRLRIGLPAWASGTSQNSLYPADSHTPYAGYPISGTVQGSMDLLLAENIAGIFSDGASTYVNTFDYQTLNRGPKFDFQVTLDVPVAPADIAAAPFDPYLYVHDTQYEIHLVDQLPALAYSINAVNNATSFRDEAGFPFAIVVPDEWHPPIAGIDMGLAYPEFVDYVGSNATSNGNWFNTPAAEKIKNIPATFWKW